MKKTKLKFKMSKWYYSGERTTSKILKNIKNSWITVAYIFKQPKIFTMDGQYCIETVEGTQLGFIYKEKEKFVMQRTDSYNTVDIEDIATGIICLMLPVKKEDNG